MLKKFIYLLFICFALNAEAQVAKISSSKTNSYEERSNYISAVGVNKSIVSPEQEKAAHEARKEEMENNLVLKTMRGFLKNSGDQKDARNIMILREVVNFKMGDEKLEKELDELENNREYNKKLNKIMSKLSNDRMRNSKNREVMRILQEAGDKIYNLLSN